MSNREISFHHKFEAIFQSEKEPVDQLADGFDFVLSRVLLESEREMEVLRALGEKGGLVKEKIKHSTIQHALEVFGDCYHRATKSSSQYPREQKNE